MNAKERKKIKIKERRKAQRQVGKAILSDPQVARDWQFNLGKVGFGPLSLGGVSMGGWGSGNPPPKFQTKQKQSSSKNSGRTSKGQSSNNGSKKGRRTLMDSMVGLAPRALDIQRSVPRLSSEHTDNGNVVDIITGTDLIGPITSGFSGNEAGDILMTQLISPAEFSFSRLAQFAALYQRYRFRRIRFIYEPIANATQSGQLVGYADFDVANELLENSAANLSIAVAHQGEQISQIWEPVVFDMAQSGTFTDLYTEQGASVSSDERLSIQGVFYIMAASVLPINIPLGNVYVDYEVEFTIPFLNQHSSSVGMASIYQGVGSVINDYQDTSDPFLKMSDWTVLTALGTQLPALVADGSYSIHIDGPFVPGQKLLLSFHYEGNPQFESSALNIMNLTLNVSPGSPTITYTGSTPAYVTLASADNYGYGMSYIADVNELCDYIKLSPNFTPVGVTYTPDWVCNATYTFVVLPPTSALSEQKLRTLLHRKMQAKKLLSRIEPLLSNSAALLDYVSRRNRHDSSPAGRAHIIGAPTGKDQAGSFIAPPRTRGTASTLARIDEFREERVPIDPTTATSRNLLIDACSGGRETSPTRNPVQKVIRL